MPIQVDSAKPVREVDTSNKPISINTNKAPAVKTVDTNNRLFSSNDASQVMNEAMKETPADKAAEVVNKQDIPANSEAEARKLFLDAQKAERRAKEMEKKAKEGLTKAQAFEKAVSLTKTGGDPGAVLTAAGIDPIKFYQDMTAQVLKEPVKKETAQEKTLREHEERLNEYAKNLEVQANTFKEREELAQHNAAIVKHVIPLIQNNPERYETLLL